MFNLGDKVVVVTDGGSWPIGTTGTIRGGRENQVGGEGRYLWTAKEPGESEESSVLFGVKESTLRLLAAG